MPLIINDVRIQYLNGPTNFVFLTPPPTSRLNYNIILLGDNHDDSTTPCSSTPEVSNCYNTINDNFDGNNEKEQFEKDITYIRSRIDDINNKNDRILNILNNMNNMNTSYGNAAKNANTRFNRRK
jgi:hypothetical protein